MKNSKLKRYMLKHGWLLVASTTVAGLCTTTIQYRNSWVTVCNENELLAGEVAQLNEKYVNITEQHEQENIFAQNGVDLLELKLSHRDATIIQLEEALKIKIEEESRVVTFEPSDITVVSNVKVEELQSVLKGTAMEDLAPYIVQAEKDHGVNALAIASIMTLESTWGTNYNAKTRNNYGGIRVNGEYKVFDSPQHCINYLARLLKNDYLVPEGKWWSGSKSVESVSRLYCENPEHWTDVVTQNANKFERLLQK